MTTQDRRLSILLRRTFGTPLARRIVVGIGGFLRWALRFWDVAGRSALASRSHGGVNFVAFGPDGRSLVSTGGGLVELWAVPRPDTGLAVQFAMPLARTGGA